jgi:hypothetical protein
VGWEIGMQQGDRPASPPSDQGVWSDGPFLIMRREAELPRRCVCCNAAVAGAVQLRVTWAALQPDPQHPLDNIPYLRLIPKIQNMARDIKVLSHPEAAVIRVGVCPAHLTRAQFLNVLVWIALPVGVLFGIAGIFAHPCFGIFVAFVGLVVWAIALKLPRPVAAVHVGSLTVTLRGAGAEFLASLPTWPHDAQDSPPATPHEAKWAAWARVGQRMVMEAPLRGVPPTRDS